MRNLESFEDAVEYRPLYITALKPFVADIYESGNLEPQSVFCYPTWFDKDVCDIEIKMPLYVKPQALRDDVEAALWAEYGLSLGDLKCNLVPENVTIHP